MLFLLSLFLISSIASIANSQTYITSPVICDLTTTARVNINKVQILSIDTYPDSFKYMKYIRPNITVPSNSGIEKKYCNSHCDNTMAGALGVRYSDKIPSLRNIKVNYVPGLLCTGGGYEPYLIDSIDYAINIAKENSLRGINTVVVYSIGGTYNTLQKINAMRTLTEIDGTYVVTPIGNSYSGQYDNCELNFLRLNPKLIIVGGTQKGNQLLDISMVGKCVNYYVPGAYKSAVTNKQIRGTSFSGPIVAYMFANYLLNFPGATREQILSFLDSKTNTVTRITNMGQTIQMKIFRKSGICKL